MTLFPEKLKELRKKNQLTQQELADKVGTNRVNITKWETGRTEPTLENIVKLSKILDTTIDELLGQTLSLRADSILGFSDRLGILRKQKGLTQKEIAELIGVYQGSYANWENGSREPRLETIVQLAKILDTTPNELLGWRK